MLCQFRRKLPEPEEIKAQFPVTTEMGVIRERRNCEIKNILSGKDDRFIMIIGPCSADNEDSVVDYVTRLAAVQEKVKDKLLLIPRIYTNKPRTTGEGYKGMLHNPDPTHAADMISGLIATRHLHIRAIKETGLTAADELLYPENYVYMDDLLSYAAIGARSVENQQHRLTASAVSVPVGMKNPTGGDVDGMLNAIIAAQHSHTFVYRGWEVVSEGNPFAHGIVRGGTAAGGKHFPNYGFDSLTSLYEAYSARNAENMAIIVDTNHSNSGKDHLAQSGIAEDVLRSRKLSADIRKMVKGLMVESYIEEGSQTPDGGVYGKSITDACIGWEETEKLILHTADNA